MGQEQQILQEAFQKCLEANHVVIRVNLNSLESTTFSPYLGRTIMYNNSDWEALYINLRKYQRRWGIVANVMGKTGAPIKACTMISKVVFQTAIIHGIESWGETNTMMKVLD